MHGLEYPLRGILSGLGRPSSYTDFMWRTNSDIFELCICGTLRFKRYRIGDVVFLDLKRKGRIIGFRNEGIEIRGVNEEMKLFYSILPTYWFCWLNMKNRMKII